MAAWTGDRGRGAPRGPRPLPPSEVVLRLSGMVRLAASEGPDAHPNLPTPGPLREGGAGSEPLPAARGLLPKRSGSLGLGAPLLPFQALQEFPNPRKSLFPQPCTRPGGGFGRRAPPGPTHPCPWKRPPTAPPRSAALPRLRLPAPAPRVSLWGRLGEAPGTPEISPSWVRRAARPALVLGETSALWGGGGDRRGPGVAVPSVPSPC